MIDLEIKSIFSSDIDDLYNWEAEDTSCVCFQISIDVGPIDEEGSNIFQVLIATPSGLHITMEKYDVARYERNVMVYQNYSFDKLHEDLKNIVFKCQCDSYHESVLKLQRFFLWEYEDYEMS